MDTRIEILKSIEEAMHKDKNVSLGQYIAYITSLDDLWYISDEDFKRLVDKDVRVSRGKSFGEITLHDQNFEMYEKGLHDLTKESEAEGYSRYRASIEGRVFFSLEERLSYLDFLCRFTDEFNSITENVDSWYKEWKVINHALSFYDIIPYRYVPVYVCAWKDDRYVAMRTNSNKIPDAPELFEYIVGGQCLSCYAPFMGGESYSRTVTADGWFAVVLDSEDACRAACYATRVQFGMTVRPVKKEIEIYAPDQAVEIFHELFAKCDTIINE